VVVGEGAFPGFEHHGGLWERCMREHEELDWRYIFDSRSASFCLFGKRLSLGECWHGGASARQGGGTQNSMTRVRDRILVLFVLRTLVWKGESVRKWAGAPSLESSPIQSSLLHRKLRLSIFTRSGVSFRTYRGYATIIVVVLTLLHQR
jgi:hypothetical protein